MPTVALTRSRTLSLTATLTFTLTFTSLMRFVFLTCGFLGFAIVALGGFTAGRAADLVLRDAALGCLAGALLGRWFWNVLMRALAQAMAARRAAEAEAAAAASQAAATTAPPVTGRATPAPRPGAAATAVPAGARTR